MTEMQNNVNHTPTWLSEPFLQSVLRKNEGDQNIMMTSYDVKPATAAGDNYSSLMLRISIQFTRGGHSETTSFILKTELEGEEMAKVTAESHVFPRESRALNTTIPAMYDLLKRACPGKYQPFTAKCLHIRDSQPAAIISEDLKAQGFRMAERMRGLDLAHCRLVITTLARFHATSVALYHQDPDKFTEYKESVYNEKNRKSVEPFFEPSSKQVARLVESWPDYRVSYAEKLHKFADSVTDLLIKASVADDKEFNVLIHGDCWLNNMMFRYSDATGDVKDVRFVDLQLCHFTNPAQDLQYFLHTSVSPDFLDKHEELIEEYHKTLGESLALLGYEHLHPTSEMLNRQMERKGIFAVLVTMTVLPIILADRNKVPDIEKIIKNEASIHFSEEYKKVLKILLPRFLQRGWI